MTNTISGSSTASTVEILTKNYVSLLRDFSALPVNDADVMIGRINDLIQSMNIEAQASSVPVTAAPTPTSQQPAAPINWLDGNVLNDRLQALHRETGYYPIILQPHGKKPFNPRSGMLRMVPDQIMKFCEERAIDFRKSNPDTYADCNLGVLTGKVSGITVIDFDLKSNLHHDAQSGMDLYKQIKLTMDFCGVKTYTVSTPSGGIHMYFKYDPRLPTRVCTKVNGKIYSVDVRNDAGYVVAVNQKLPNGVYCVVEDAPVAAMPDLVFELVKHSARSTPSDYFALRSSPSSHQPQQQPAQTASAQPTLPPVSQPPRGAVARPMTSRPVAQSRSAPSVYGNFVPSTPRPKQDLSAVMARALNQSLRSAP